MNDQLTDGPGVIVTGDIVPPSICQVTDCIEVLSVAVPETFTVGLVVDVLLAGVVIVRVGRVVSLTFTTNVWLPCGVVLP